MNNKEKLQEATLNELYNLTEYQSDIEQDQRRTKQFIEKTVELNGVKRTLYSQDEVDCFNAMKARIGGLESSVKNYMVDISMGIKQAYITFGTDDGYGEFNVEFDTESFGKVTKVQTTYSNQNITYDFVKLAELLYELKN